MGCRQYRAAQLNHSRVAVAPTAPSTVFTGTGGSSVWSLTATPCPPVTLSPASLPDGMTGTAYNQAISSSGGTVPYSYAVTSGTPPTGLNLSSTGALSGTPTTSGTFSFTVTATDEHSCTGSQVYAITIAPSSCPTITLLPTSLPSGAVGTSYSQTIAASGGITPYSYVKTSGNFPSGLSLSSGGVLSGTPTASGTFTFTVTAMDAHSCTGSQAYSLIINPGSCPTVTLSPTSLPDGKVGTAYSQAITASGGTTPYSYAVTSGTLPTGASLSLTGVLSGTCTAPVRSTSQ